MINDRLRLKNKWDKAAQQYTIKEAKQQAALEAMPEVARKLKGNGYSVELIVGVTELTVEEVIFL